MKVGTIVKLLVIEDNRVYQERLAVDLTELGYDVEIFTQFQNYTTHDYSPYDLVLLDIGLPDLDGREIITYIKNSSKAKIIILTSTNSGEVEYKSLLLGADDYIIKPHFVPVLNLKIQALISTNNQDTIICGHHINLQTLTIDNKIKLTAKEYKILIAIYNSTAHQCTKNELLRNLWESDFFVEEGALYTMIYRLRKKIESTNINITNTRGGYKIDD